MKEIIIPTKMDYVHKTLVLTLLCIIIMLVGSAMNIVVIYSNACRMPVEDLGFETNVHFSYFSEDYKSIHYYYFSDKYHFFDYIYSIGDLIMTLDFILIFWIIFRVGRVWWKKIK